MPAFPRQTDLKKEKKNLGPQNKRCYYIRSPKSLKPKRLQTTAVGLVLYRC